MLAIPVMEWLFIIVLFILGLAVSARSLTSEIQPPMEDVMGPFMTAVAIIWGVGAVTHGGSLVVPIYESLERVGTML